MNVKPGVVETHNVLDSLLSRTCTLACLASSLDQEGA